MCAVRSRVPRSADLRHYRALTFTERHLSTTQTDNPLRIPNSHQGVESHHRLPHQRGHKGSFLSIADFAHPAFDNQEFKRDSLNDTTHSLYITLDFSPTLEPPSVLEGTPTVVDPFKAGTARGFLQQLDSVEIPPTHRLCYSQADPQYYFKLIPKRTIPLGGI